MIYPYAPEVQERFAAVMEYRNQDFKKGIEGFRAIIRDYPEDGAVLARAYYYLAETATMQSDFEHAKEYCELGIKYGKESGNYRCQILCIIQLSSMKITELNEAVAAEYLYEALELVEKHDEHNLDQMIYIMLAQLFDSIEDYETAITYYRMSLEAFEEQYPNSRKQYPSIYGSRVLNMACCYLALNRTKELEEAYQELVDINFAETIPVFVVVMDILKGYIAYLNGKKEEAVSLMHKALEGFQKEQEIMDTYVMLENVYDVFEAYGLVSDQKCVLELLERYTQTIPSQKCSALFIDLTIRYNRKIRDTKALVDAYEAYYDNQKNYHSDSLRQKQEYIKLRRRLYEEDFEYQKKLKELKQLSSTDALTGLENRHSLLEYTNDVFAESVAKQQYFGLLFLDIDRYKEYNDSLGHIAGDECLRKVADIFKEVLKGHFCARYGGDEFICVLSGVNQEQISALCTEIHKQIRLLNLEHLHNSPYNVVTVSLGVSVRIPSASDDFILFLQEADECLYQCKEKGRNNTVFYNGQKSN